jgi:hypothetical protein
MDSGLVFNQIISETYFEIDVGLCRKSCLLQARSRVTVLFFKYLSFAKMFNTVC